MPKFIEEAIITFVQNVYNAMGWWGVILLMAIESASIPLPSEVIMPLAGWFLVEARGGSMTEALLLGGLCGGLGCLIGSLLTYALGYYGGRPLVLRFGRYVLLNEHHLETAERWFARWGWATAFFSRLLPVVRTFISIPAGVSKMNVALFSALTFAGSVIWSAALAALGFSFGAKWEDLRNAMRPFDYPIIVIILLLIAYFFYRQIRARRTHKEA